MNDPDTINDRSAADLITDRIAELADWRGETLTRMRALILAADPQVIEEWKWRGTPVWSRDGILCTGETYTQVVKLTFAKGAALPDPAGLFNASLDGNVRRAIDIREGEVIDAAAFQALVLAAVALNGAKAKAGKQTGFVTEVGTVRGVVRTVCAAGADRSGRRKAMTQREAASAASLCCLTGGSGSD